MTRAATANADPDLYDHAIGRLVRYHPEVVPATEALLEAEPDFAMGHALAAYLSLSSTDVPDLDAARVAAAELTRLARTDREPGPRRGDRRAGWRATGTAPPVGSTTTRSSSPTTSSRCWSATSSTSSAATPRTSATGWAARSAASTPPHPLYGFVRGMYAFGLEEAGHYELAEGHGLAAVDANPDDVWATHAVVHVYEMRGQVDTGIGFLQQQEPHWTARQPLHRPQLVAPRASSCWRRAGPTAPSPSTTPRSTTPGRPAYRWRCWTPAPCCGACSSTACPPAIVSPSSPMRGRPGSA